MNFLTSIYTDVGIKKKNNQDSALILKAETDRGEVLLAVICDGMGGLAKGEVASAAVIHAFNSWFKKVLPILVYSGIDTENVFGTFEDIVLEMNERIVSYGTENGVSLGTTVTAMLLFDNIYYIINVGDSRAYKLSDNIYQLTKDQSYVQREIDLGHMTPEEARSSPHRNVLLQCVGASKSVKPDFYTGKVDIGDCFLLCSDGFRHVVSPTELFEKMNPFALTDEQVMKKTLAYFTELNKNRHETDNITAMLIKVV